MKFFPRPRISKRTLHYAALVLWDYTKKLVRFLLSGSGTRSPFTARFMSRLEQLKLLSEDNTGIVVNGKLRLDADKSFRHMLLTGATGAGKSSVIFVPQILTTPYPMIILDCSGSLFDQTSGSLKAKGFRILRLNFSAPLLSESYNPMMRADTDSKCKRLASTLVDIALGGSGSGDSFWNKSAAQVLYCLMRCLRESAEPQYQNLANVRHLLNNLSANQQSPTFLWLMEHASEEVFSELQGELSGTEKVVNSILSTARTALEKLSDPMLARLTATDSLGDLRKIRRKKTALYLTIKETEISYLSFLISVVLNDLLDAAMEMPTAKDLPLFFCLDEFAHFKVKDFSTMLTTLRKRQVSCTISVQSKSMLAHKYGQNDAESIITGGCASHMILPGQQNPRENEELSRLLGSHMVEYKGRAMQRPIITPDEIYSLKGKGIFLHSGYRPAKLTLYPFYENKKLLAMTKKRPVSYKRKKLPELTLLPLTAEKE